MATQMTKSQLIEQVATASKLAKKDIKGVMEALAQETAIFIGVGD